MLLYNNCVFCHRFLVCSSIQNRLVKLQDREKGSLLIREWQSCVCRGKGLINNRLSEWSLWASVVFALTATFIRTITSLFPPPSSLIDLWNCLPFFFSLCTAITSVSCHQLLYGTWLFFTWNRAPHISADPAFRFDCKILWSSESRLRSHLISQANLLLYKYKHHIFCSAVTWLSVCVGNTH